MTMSTIADGIGSDDSVGFVEFYDHVADFVAADMESIYHPYLQLLQERIFMVQ